MFGRDWKFELALLLNIYKEKSKSLCEFRNLIRLAANLHSRSDTSSLATGEQSSSSTRVEAKIEVNLSTVLVRHIADRVAVNGAKVVDLDLDGVRSDRVSVQIGVDS